jgi:hypothetical protein
MTAHHIRPKGASLYTLTVYEEDEIFAQYAGGSKIPVAVFDRERAVLAAARAIAIQQKLAGIRVNFILQPTTEKLAVAHLDKPLIKDYRYNPSR